MAATKKVVRVRMYDIGFGDCFLIFIPVKDAPGKKVLVDCGSIAKRKKTTAQIVKQLIADVTDADGVARIDVVVATHRHRDHVAGFSRADWKKVEVGEVWMPWTEHPTEAEATRIRETQAGFAAQLNLAFSKLGIKDERLLNMALNALTNQAAMDTLHEGFAGCPVRRFLPTEGTAGRLLETSVLPGVRVHVLGPSRAEDVIRDMDPPHDQSFFRAAGVAADGDGGATDGEGAMEPFGKDWVADEPGELSKADLKALHRIAEGLDELLAVALDKAVNGTSLMLMFEVGGAHLLFPGDAQWGTWNAALEDKDFAKLLKKTAFYKVGHHGSHNSTPVRFVEDFLDKKKKAPAMVSVRPRSIWPEIPRMPLLKALKKKGARVVRSDESKKVTGFKREKDLWVETKIKIK